MNKTNLICPICGEPTNVYMGNARKDKLCLKHGKMLNKGEIKKLDFTEWESIDLWDFADIDVFIDATDYSILNMTKLPYKLYKRVLEEIEKLKNSNPSTTTNDETDIEQYNDVPEIIKVENTIKCITCGYESDGKLFCKRCYQRFKDKTILVKIRNCIEIESLDTSYEGHYVCDDGHVVKSQAEREIDDYLFSHDYKHGYELELCLKDSNNNDVILHPDFCIFGETEEENVYIEYWGVYGNRKYTETKKYKMPIYEKSGITLINLYGKTDLRNIKSALKRKLDPKNYKIGQVNFKED